jgi:magnesium chelatase subunit I
MSRRTTLAQSNAPRSQPPVYPFTAIVGQQEMKLALLLNVIEPTIGGVLIMGHRGTGKSTAVRALADLLPPVWKVRDCLYGCDPSEQDNLCADCVEHLTTDGKLARTRAHVPVIDLPLGATEDRVCGAINIERALTQGVKAFDPGLLARAHRGFLYIDEVNLLEDHLVDLLLDVAVTGRNRVEREGISVEHPARFVLVGSGNPEEGELRPQLIDRFGLHVEVTTANDLDERVQIILAREEFERDPANFRARVENEQETLRRRLTRARKKVHEVKVARELLRRIAELCVRLKVDGHRGELTITRAARALAAFEGRREATDQDVRRVAKMSLRHRLRRDPLEQTSNGARIEQALDNLFPVPDQREEQPRAADERGKDDTPPSGFTGNSGGDGGTDGGTKNSGGGTRGGQSSSARTNSSGSDRTNSAPALDARLPEDALDSESRAPAQPRSQSQSARRQLNARRSIYNDRRGRYARSVITPSSESKIALDATLRASIGAGGWELGAGEKKEVGFSSLIPNPQPLSPLDLRFKRFKRKSGTLFIFAIDASGSMALNRINQAKGALVNLLQK